MPKASGYGAVPPEPGHILFPWMLFRERDWEQYVSNIDARGLDSLRFFGWKNSLDYGTGMSGDLFVHLFSSLYFIAGSTGPNKIPRPSDCVTGKMAEKYLTCC